MADPAQPRIAEGRPHGARIQPGEVRRRLLEERVLTAGVGCESLRRVHRHPADRLVARVGQGVQDADRDQREVALEQAMDGAIDLEQQFAAQDVQRLLERMEVATEPAAGLKGANRDLGVDGALLGADDDRPGEAMGRRGRRERRRDPIPVNPSDETGQRCAPCCGCDINARRLS